MRPIIDVDDGNKNIALTHVEFDLIPHYHINKDWRENVFYEHRFGGKTYIYTPEQEINYLYRKWWKEPGYRKDATLEYRMKYLDKKGTYEPVAMYFRNAYMQEFSNQNTLIVCMYDK
ncbi:MAG: hypothetical protein ACXWME_12370 [Syntrophales bacterium]